MKINNIRLLLALLLLPLAGYAQNLSGVVKNARTGEVLPAVNVYVAEQNKGAVTNAQGFYLLQKLQKGKLLVQFSCYGFESFFATVIVDSEDVVLNVDIQPSFMEIKEVKIIGMQQQSPKETSHTISEISVTEMRENGSLSISDAVSRLPGVSQLSTGAGISKPVIRGLYGNRVQVNVLGLRFDNQQSQDEHGLGISDMGVNRVEIIKGPATLMYGSDAMGGVLNVIEEKPAPVNSVLQDVNFKAFSNTYGVGADYGFRKSAEKKWLRIRAGFENHADYSSGGNKRVLNSRFANYNLKLSRGYNGKNFTNANSAYVSFSQYGFVFDSLDRKALDARLSRSFDGPHHRVLFGVLSSENTFYLDKKKLKINGGLISNLRQEQEGANRISLNMLLNTASVGVQLVTQLNGKTEWTNGLSGMVQSNTNFGSRTIVPDAFTTEGAIYSYLKKYFGSLVAETGLRFDLRNIQTFQTQNINSPASEIQPFDNLWTALNGNAGLAYNPLENLNFKANVSSGYRSGNLAELSSNGLHEGTLRWEVGDPHLKTEQNLNAETGFTYEFKEQVELSATGFYNTFRNYIYLAPTGTEYVGFDIYRFRQTNAVLKGAEIALDVHPEAVKWLDLSSNYTYLHARKSDGTYLPFIPANKISTSAKIRFAYKGKLKNTYVKATQRYVFAQNEAAEFETPTPAYTLYDIAFGGAIQRKQQLVNFSLVCTNLFDLKYADHLSRFKYFGINNMGRNINLNISYPF